MQNGKLSPRANDDFFRSPGFEPGKLGTRKLNVG
jgi:hypothetical protein